MNDPNYDVRTDSGNELESAPRPPDGAPRPMRAMPAWLQSMLASLLPALLAVWWYIPTLHFDFIFDDRGEMDNFDGLFTPGRWPLLFFRAQYQLYRPIKYITLHADHTLWGMEPWGFHLTNILLHGVVCALLAVMLRRLGAGTVAAGLATVWYAIHPITIEPVAWVTARGSMLSAIGVLGAMICYLGWRRSGGLVHLVGFGFAAWFAFFSKEDALMLLPAIVALEFWGAPEPDAPPQSETTFDPATGADIAARRRRLRLIIALAVGAIPAALYLLLRHRLLDGLAQGTRPDGMLGAVPWIIARYILMLIHPRKLTLEPPIDFGAGLDLRFWLSCLLLAALAASTIGRGRGRWRFALAWFFLFLFPTSGVIPINAPAADRFLYIPAMGCAFLIAWGLGRIRPGYLVYGAVALVALMLPFKSEYLAGMARWRNDLALWEGVSRANPKSWRAWNNIAVERNKVGEHGEALALAQRTLALKPDYIEAMVTEAWALDRLARPAEAEAAYRRALALNPDNTIALYVFADFLERSHPGNPREAESVYNHVLRIRPGHVGARLAAGILAIQRGDKATAIGHWEAVLHMDPTNREALHNLRLARGEK